MKPENFTHLHNHTHYSLLNALPKVLELVRTAKDMGMKSLAITDDGNMYATINFYQTCLKEGIKPILGVDFYVALSTRFEKRAGIDNRRHRLVLIAKNKTGYKNLMKLVSLANIEGFYYKPRIDRELIEKYSEGLICISPQFSGEVAKAINLSDIPRATHALNFLKSTFKDDLYLEVVHHPEIEGQLELKEKIIKFADQTNTPLVACHDTYYLKTEDRKARNVLMSVSNTGPKRDLNDESEDFSFITPEKVFEYFKDRPESIENTQKIVDKCNIELDIDSWYFPEIDIPKGETYDTYLRRLSFEGIEKRGLKKTSEIEERINYELEIIKNKGYSSYFLIVSDLIAHARETGIYTNTRGSAAGSLVSYLNFITKVNPVELGLPFERFMNPERPGIPDIDLDVADIRRDDLIAYAKEKYGKDAVAQIGTFGTMAARGSVRDTARAMGYDYATGDKISKLIPMGAQGFPMTIKRALAEEPDLKKLYDSDKDTKTIIDMAQKIEGCARHISTHAAGVVISPTTLNDFTPIELDKDGQTITQYDMYTGGRDGVVNMPKFDILGIKNLSILSNAVKIVEKTTNIKIDLDTINLKDEKTFNMLASGNTVGCFQLSGTGMTKVITDMRPTTIDDINAIVALYRPGPMEFIKDYIERKYNPEKRTHLHPKLEKILEKSFGVITYQDDILLIAIELAGYSWLEADKFRKAIGKKIPELMQEQKDKFYTGCREGGVQEKVINELWAKIETFAAYGFNKAHAASYGRVAYETSYMKANFPAQYMAAVLTADAGDTEKIAEIVTECKRMNLKVLPPDINESFKDFAVVPAEDDEQINTIRFGLLTIKNFGEGISNIIIAERKQKGKFKSLSDFLSRIKDKNLNKKSLEALIKSGALDTLGERGQMLFNIENLLAFNKEEVQKDQRQDSLLKLLSEQEHEIHLEKSQPAKKEDMLAWEKELLGLYISGHPLDKWTNILKKDGKNIKSIKENSKDGVTLVIACVIDEIRVILTKKGDKMAFVKVSDLSDSADLVIFPKAFEQYKEKLESDKPAMLKCTVSRRDGEFSAIIEKVKELV